MYICIYIYMYIYVYVYIYIYVYMYMYECMYMYIYMYMRIYMYMCVHICMCVHIYIYIYIHWSRYGGTSGRTGPGPRQALWRAAAKSISGQYIFEYIGMYVCILVAVDPTLR